MTRISFCRIMKSSTFGVQGMKRKWRCTVSNMIHVVQSLDGKPYSLECKPSKWGPLPEFTRENCATIIRWLWGFDPELTYDVDERAPRITYLLDDLMLVLRGGIYSIAYPTDYGKSTLVDMSVVLSLIFNPNNQNLIIKANEEAATAAALACYYKLKMAFKGGLEYCRPIAVERAGTPSVKSGFWIDGSELREFGSRDRSVVPLSIYDGSVPGRRGRTHMDDLEDLTKARSEAKMRHLRDQVASTVRHLQRFKDDTLWLICGTPAGSNSLMFLPQKLMGNSSIPVSVISRPRIMTEGIYKGLELWPAARMKAEIQKGLLDDDAYAVAFELRAYSSFDPDAAESQLFKVPISDKPFDEASARRAVATVLYGRNPGLEEMNEAAAAEWLRKNLNPFEVIAGWDPSSDHHFGLTLTAFSPGVALIIEAIARTGDVEVQTAILAEWAAKFPDMRVVFESNAEQKTAAKYAKLYLPTIPFLPHYTTSAKGNDSTGVPAMMAKIAAGNFALPMPAADSDGYYGFLREIRLWDPVTAHPHALIALWISWFYYWSNVMGGLPEQSPSGAITQPTKSLQLPSLPPKLEGSSILKVIMNDERGSLSHWRVEDDVWANVDPESSRAWGSRL